MRLSAGNAPYLHAPWLMDKPSQICFYMSWGDISGSFACLADADSQSLLPIRLSGHQFSGSSQFGAICSEAGSALDVLCWSPHSEQDWSFEDQIIVFDASSRQVLYQLSSPEHLHSLFLQLQHDNSSRDEPSPNRQQLWGREVLVAPNKQLLAVIWSFGLVEPVSSQDLFTLVGLSIHSASKGDLLYSMILMAGIDADEKCQPGWLPCSSNFLYFSNGGLLNLITTSDERLWSSGLTGTQISPQPLPGMSLLKNRVHCHVDAGFL